MSPIVSLRPRESSRRPAPGVVSPSDWSKPPAGGIDATEPRQAAPRIVPDGDGESARRGAPVLLAGADARGRAILRAEFGETLAPRTGWVEADDVAGVLERAAYSRMAILAGDLDDSDAGSLMRLLGRRHPELPVIRVDACTPAVAGGRG
jgi:hypothetical protein